MKKLITEGLGGHPVKYKDFEFIQEMIREVVKSFSMMAPSNNVVVMSGCKVTTDGSVLNMGKGAVIYDNELFMVSAQSIEKQDPEHVAQWFIKETNDARGEKTFKSGLTKQVFLIREFEIRYAADGTGIGNIDGSRQYTSYFGGVPIGFVGMWSGDKDNIPDGWALCNGNIVNGYTTPNMRDKMIVGYNEFDQAEGAYNNPGNLSVGGTTPGMTGNGGGKVASFGVNDIPKHRHGKGSLGAAYGGSHSHAIAFKELQREAYNHSAVLDYTVNDISQADYIGYTATQNATDTQKGAHSHEIAGDTADAGNTESTVNKDLRHPYYVLAFIIRVG